MCSHICCCCSEDTSFAISFFLGRNLKLLILLKSFKALKFLSACVASRLQREQQMRDLGGNSQTQTRRRRRFSIIRRSTIFASEGRLGINPKIPQSPQMMLERLATTIKGQFVFSPQYFHLAHRARDDNLISDDFEINVDSGDSLLLLPFLATSRDIPRSTLASLKHSNKFLLTIEAKRFCILCKSILSSAA